MRLAAAGVWRSQQRNLELVLGLRNSVSDALTPIGDVTADVISWHWAGWLRRRTWQSGRTCAASIHFLPVETAEMTLHNFMEPTIPILVLAIKTEADFNMIAAAGVATYVPLWLLGVKRCQLRQ